MDVKLNIFLKNEEEWVLAQKVLFVLGYSWPVRNKKIVPYRKEYEYIDVWNDGDITRDDRKERNRNILTFDEFIDYIDINDMRYGN